MLDGRQLLKEEWMQISRVGFKPASKDAATVLNLIWKILYSRPPETNSIHFRQRNLAFTIHHSLNCTQHYPATTHPCNRAMHPLQFGTEHMNEIWNCPEPKGEKKSSPWTAHRTGHRARCWKESAQKNITLLLGGVGPTRKIPPDGFCLGRTV